MNDEILDDLIEEQIEKRKSTRKFSPRWGRIILILLIAAAALGVYLAYNRTTYHHYEIESRIKRPSSENTFYKSLGGRLFSYSRDGASLSSFDGNLVWTESFDMENPSCEVTGDYALVYDRESTSALIFDSSGQVGSLAMTMPIVRASIAANGDVAILMQNGETANLRMYSPEGKLIASGEVHARNTGYPVAMSISPDAKRLLVSLLDLNDGDVKTTLCFYDFSDESDNETNHIAANFSYADQVIPEVAFMKEGAVAFGDEELIFFSDGKEIEVKKEVFLSEEAKLVFHSPGRVGVITTKERESGKNENMLYVYQSSGAERFSHRVPGNIMEAEFMRNDEILVHNGKGIRIFRDDGTVKFGGRVEDPIRTVFPSDGQRNYYFITKDQSQKVVLH